MVQPARPERRPSSLPRAALKWLAAAGLVALVVSAGVLMSGTARARVDRPAAPAHGKVYWGAWIGKQFTGTEAPWDMKAVTAFQRVAGKGLSLIHFSSPFADCRDQNACVPYSFPTQAFESVRKYGAIPFFSWGSSAAPVAATRTQFSLTSIIRGDHDAYIRNWAEAAAGWGHPFFLRFDWEMNGRWSPWSQAANGGRPDLFVRAWRHVHDLFAAAGARNATWVWCPNVDPRGVFSPLRPLYPGNAYVDWTCLDVYNFDHPWESFDQLLHGTYETVRQIAPNKPMVLGEVGSTEAGGSKARWIRTALTEAIPSRYPLVRGFLWFEKHSSHAWQIESSKASQRAFVTGIRRSVYVRNSVGSLPFGPVRPAR
jgi:glycosyl hydrolase family 26